MNDTEFAPAKVNLSLRVWPLGPDGYHPIESWMVFADIGDTLSLHPADAMSFAVAGPYAAIVPTDATNLAVRARDAFLSRTGGAVDPFRLVLDKRLPAASGIGGGSSDAAAVLRLLQRRCPIADDVMFEIALSLGSDVPACLEAESLVAVGRGEILEPAPLAPGLPAVLVNPGVAVSTAAVFRAFDRDPRPGEWASPRTEAHDVESAIDLVTPLGNDLEGPAITAVPLIGEVLTALRADPRCRLARMSGSGATCFALCGTASDAGDLARAVSAANPAWWVRATMLS